MADAVREAPDAHVDRCSRRRAVYDRVVSRRGQRRSRIADRCPIDWAELLVAAGRHGVRRSAICNPRAGELLAVGACRQDHLGARRAYEGTDLVRRLRIDRVGRLRLSVGRVGRLRRSDHGCSDTYSGCSARRIDRHGARVRAGIGHRAGACAPRGRIDCDRRKQHIERASLSKRDGLRPRRHVDRVGCGRRGVA